MKFQQTLVGAVPIGPTKTIDSQKDSEGGSILAWFVPDIAMLFGLVTLLSLFFVFEGATTLFDDSDSGWHIRTGERIISSRSLPRSDPYSFSRPGAPWGAWEWGADVLMGSVHRVFGLDGVALLYGLSISTSVWMWFQLNRAAGGIIPLSSLFFVPMLLNTKMHWLARPHVFSWLFLLGTVWFCERIPHRVRWSHLALAAIVEAGWANLHASFFLGPVIVLNYAAGADLKPLIWEGPSTNPGAPPIEKPWGSKGLNYILIAVAASVGTLANPNGLRLHQHVFTYVTDSRLLAQIMEFQPFDFHAAGAFHIMFTLALCFAGGYAALSAHKPERFLLSIMLIALALRSARAMPVAALLLLPLANGSITSVLSRAGKLVPELRRRIDYFLNYSHRLDALDRRLRGFAIVPLFAVLTFAFIRTTSGFPANQLPVEASSRVASLPRSARMFAPDYYGGYLIYRFKGERKVFFDGRSDFYGAEFTERYLRLLQVRPGWTKEFNQWKFTHALLPVDYPLVSALEANGWQEVYRDKTAVLLTGRSSPEKIAN